MNTTKIMFKGDRLGLKIIIDKSLSFEEIKEELINKSATSKAIFGNTSTGITFIGKELTDEETKVIVDILYKEYNLEVNFTVDEMYVNKYLASQKTEPVKAVENLASIEKNVREKINRVFSENENNTVFHKGSLRSGAEIKHNGSIVVVGDVNAGAEIIAEGNVIILGNAKGLIQAGCTGNNKCFVFALNLLPTQLRIGEIIAFLPKEEKRSKGDFKPQVAYIDEEKIFISEI